MTITGTDYNGDGSYGMPGPRQKGTVLMARRHEPGQKGTVLMACPDRTKRGRLLWHARAAPKGDGSYGMPGPVQTYHGDGSIDRRIACTETSSDLPRSLLGKSPESFGCSPIPIKGTVLLID